MLYRILFALLVVFVAAACGDSPRNEKKSELVSPTVPAKPIVVADSTVGTLPQASGASPAGEYQINVPLDVPAGRAGMAPSLSLAYSSSAGRDTLGFGWSLQGAASFIRVCAAPHASRGVHERPDSFCLDQQVLVEIKNGEWRTENESFAKIVQTSNDWEVWSKDGRIRTYEPVTAETNIRFWALSTAFQKLVTTRLRRSPRRVETRRYTNEVTRAAALELPRSIAHRYRDLLSKSQENRFLAKHQRGQSGTVVEDFAV